MLTRRHIRVKVMQGLYAMAQTTEDTLEKEKKFLSLSMEKMGSLYLLHLSLFIELQARAADHLLLSSKKYISSSADLDPSKAKFSNNLVLAQIKNNEAISSAIAARKLNTWYLHEEYVKIIFKEIIESAAYTEYLKDPANTYEEDLAFLIKIFKEIIAPNDKLYDFLEDHTITWADDMPIVNTFLLKQLKKLTPKVMGSDFIKGLAILEDDVEFAQNLLVKTALKENILAKETADKTPKWDKDRIADIDGILLKMAICELLFFPSIPVRVTINEYLEIAKEYSTPKSSIFINGILDSLSKEFKDQGRLEKVGRGLL